MDRLTRPPWQLTLIGAGVVATAAIVTWAAIGSSSSLSHRAAYDKARAGYQVVQDEGARQALATPAQMTALLHSFVDEQAKLHVQADERTAWSAMLSAARAEMTALCELPTTRADELSSIDNLNQYCPLSRPSHLASGRPASAVYAAEQRLAAAIDALPVR